MKVKIGGLLDVSTIDFPQRVCSVIFFCGCPFRCPYCHNWSLFVEENCEWKECEEIISKLKSNRLIDGVTITGGEPTQQIYGLKNILRNAKSYGLATKIDTNGFFPKRIEKLIADKILDYVALDIKAPLQPDIYSSIIGLPESGSEIIKNIRESLRLLIESNIPLEVRTTIVPGFIDKEEYVETIVKEITGVDTYVLQQFRPDKGTLNPELQDLAKPSREQLIELARIAKSYLSDVRIRTTIKGEEKIKG